MSPKSFHCIISGRFYSHVLWVSYELHYILYIFANKRKCCFRHFLLKNRIEWERERFTTRTETVEYFDIFRLFLSRPKEGDTGTQRVNENGKSIYFVGIESQKLKKRLYGYSTPEPILIDYISTQLISTLNKLHLSIALFMQKWNNTVGCIIV